MEILFDEYLFILIGLILIYLILYKKYIISVLLIIFILYFLRTPTIKIDDPKSNIFYSPCSGQIRYIKEELDKFKISIFLSVFDNHTQYVPIKSKFLWKHNVGKVFNPAFLEHSINNYQIQNTFYNKKYNFTYKINQITGVMARRILNYMVNKTDYSIGDKIGFILLGSRVDIYIPKQNVKKFFKKEGDFINPLEPLVSIL